MTGQNGGGERSGVDVRVTGPGGATEHSAGDVTAGKFAFTAADGGLHRVCFASRAVTPRSVTLDFATGVDATDYADVARKEHLKPLELQLRKMEDRVEGVHKEMMFQREREEAHRNTSESTNARVQWFSLLTIAVVLGTAGYQIFALYSYLKRMKFFD